MIDLKRVYELGATATGRIGIGAQDPLESIRRSVRETEEKGLPEVVLYGGAEDLCRDLRDGKLCAGVRGNLGSAEVIDSIKRIFGVPKVLRVALLVTAGGKPFFLAPVGIDEGNLLEDRLELLRQGTKYLRCLEVTPRIAVLSRGRAEDAARGEEIRRSLEEGDRLTELARQQGLSAEHRYILIERAVEEANFVIAPDGVSGNLIFRSLYFLGDGRAIGAPVVNIDRVFVDTSRDKRSYTDSIALAAALEVAMELRRPG